MIGGRRAARRARSGSRRSRSSDHRTAAQITRTSIALRSLPALDHALSTGALTLDQVAAAAEFATPGQRCRARAHRGRQAAQRRSRWPRARSPRPTVTDDQALYERRALSMTWTRGRRELVLQRPAAARAGRRLRAGHLEHRQAASARSTSRPAPSSTGSSPPPTRSSHSPGRRRRRAAA